MQIDTGTRAADLSDTIEYKEPPYEDYEVDNIKWLTIHEFSVEAAEQKINEFIKVLTGFSIARRQGLQAHQSLHYHHTIVNNCKPVT